MRKPNRWISSVQETLAGQLLDAGKRSLGRDLSRTSVMA